MFLKQEKKFRQYNMVRSISLVGGLGNLSTTRKYYDNWANKYDLTLNQWKYTVPKKSINLLKKRLKKKPNLILDLACGTGLFGEELIKTYNNSQIYGSDISQKSLQIAEEKGIYKKLTKTNFENKKYYRIKFDLVSLLGAMTYCSNFDKLFSNIKFYLLKNGHFIFSHRLDLWEKQKFDQILQKYKYNLEIKYISKPQNYLPLNKDFKNKIKIRIVLLQKYKK